MSRLQTILTHVKNNLWIVVVAILLASSLSPILGSNQVKAISTVPATVSADPLPTAQIDGIVWAQVTVGNIVYATGHFSSARPAGIAIGGPGTVTRTNLLAYNITTGVLDTQFVHSLASGSDAHSGGRAIAVSPDHTTLYVGGNFTAVDGQAHANIAAFNLSTNKVISGFQGVNRPVLSVTATNNVVYIGGSFSQVASYTRLHLAAFNAMGGLTGWSPSTNGAVEAIILSPDQSKVVIGGPFDQLNGKPYYGMGAVTASSPGSSIAWASQSANFPIRDTDPISSGASITSFSENNSLIFLTAFNFTTTTKPGGFEGRAAISPTDGKLVWMNDCHGDSYSAFPIGNVLYSVSHEHDCSAIGGFLEQPQRIHMHAEAETLTVDGKNVKSDANYTSYVGQPRSSQLEWYPLLNAGTVSGASQAAWSITGNPNYVALGGEFTTANNTPQQGLVRYTIRSNAPNKIGPAAYQKYGIVAHGVNSAGQSIISMTTTSDPDDAVLTYRLYRDKVTSPIYTANIASHSYQPSTFNFIDTKLSVGSTHLYRLVATDPYGNSTTTNNLLDDTNPAVIYSSNGSWVTTTSGANQGDYFQGIHYTRVNGASATLTFTGSAISVVTEKNTDRGIAQVSIDGGAPVSINLYSSTFLTQQSVYSSGHLTPGLHKLSITKISGTYMDVDGFLVIP